VCDKCKWKNTVKVAEELLEAGDYEFARRTVEGIRDWVKERKHCTLNQKKALQNIRSTTDRKDPGKVDRGNRTQVSDQRARLIRELAQAHDQAQKLTELLRRAGTELVRVLQMDDAVDAEENGGGPEPEPEAHETVPPEQEYGYPGPDPETPW
jgi:hypothetical protein